MHTAGEEVQDNFATLADTGATYDEAVAALNAHFQPQVNVTFQIPVFRSESQKVDETVLQFVVRLRKLAQHCEFRAQTDAFVPDQVVDKCISKKLCTQLPAERDLTLDHLLTLAQTEETSERQAAQTADADSAFALRHTKQNARRSNNRGGSSSSMRKPPEQMNRCKCGRCGLQSHRSDQRRCTRDKRCHKCNRVEHFAIMCRWKQRKPQPHDKHSVHFLDDQDKPSDSFSDTEASAQVYAFDS